MSPNILFICGSLNQTTQMHQIASQMPDCNCQFTPFYADGMEDFAARLGWLNSTILGGRHRSDTITYLADHRLPVDWRGAKHSYDLVVLCTDLIIPRNVQRSRVVLVQEGITVPEGPMYQLVRNIKFLPRYLADTSATGLSDGYDLFCVASEGYRELFIQKGIRPEKIAVTGIPNFDNLASNTHNPFPQRDYLLVATSPYREAGHFEDRLGFIRKCVQIAAGRPMIFKLHPLENAVRARKEIASIIPSAQIFTTGNVNHMIANAGTVITQQSSCTFVALALEKDLYTQLDLAELHRLMPIQNSGDSARRIAGLCQRILHTPLPQLEGTRFRSRDRMKAPSLASRIQKRVRETPNP